MNCIFLEILQVNTANTEKKKRNRCSWQTCNKKLGLTSKFFVERKFLPLILTYRFRLSLRWSILFIASLCK